MARSETETETAQPQARGEQSVFYIYGVVPAEVEQDPQATGVGSPPRPVRLVRSGPIAALVAELPAGDPLGTPEDLTAHARVLNSAVSEVPVIPLRFGAVVANLEAVTAEFLEPYTELFQRALRRIEGHVQFILRGRYVQDAVLRELFDQDAQAARLRDQVGDQPEETSRDARIALGERIGHAVEAKRDADTRAAAERLGDLGIPVSVGAPSHEWDALNVACLVDPDQEKLLREFAADLAGEQRSRMSLRLLGPMAAYDFVPSGPNS